MNEPTNAELAFRLKQLEDRLRTTRVDLDRIQAEVDELRGILKAGAVAAPSQASPKSPAPIDAKRSAPVSAAESTPSNAGATVSGRVPGAARESTQARSGVASTGRVVAAPRGSSEPPGPSIIATAIAAIRSRLGGIPLEEFVGLNLLNKIGVMMLVIGGGFFLRIAYQWVGPEIKLAGLTLLAAGALIGGEFFFRKRGDNFRLFGLGLAAGGSVLLFFNAFAAYHIEATRVIPVDQAAFAYLLLLIVAGGIVANSLRYDSEAFTGFAYLLAFISISINESEASAERFTGHFALVALAILAVSLILILSLRRWKFLGVLGLLGTYANFFWYASALPRTLEGFVWRGEALTDLQNFADYAGAGPDYFLFAFLYLSIYWIVFSVSVFTMPAQDPASRRIGGWLNIANVLCFYFLVAYIRPPSTAWGSFAVTGGLGLACLGIGVLGRLLNREHLWTSSVLLGAGLLALAIPFRFSDYGLVFGWLIQATALIALGYSLRESLFRYAGYLILLINVGAFLNLPAGDLFYGYGPEIHSSIGEVPADAGLPEAGPPLWSFDWNRGLLYVFMIVCFFGLQTFASLASFYRGDDSEADPRAAKFSGGLLRRGPIDQIAWHALGGFGTLVVFLLSHFSFLIGQQALALVPFALLLLIPHRALRIGPFLLYSVVLLWAALLSASALIVANEGPGLALYQRLSLILLFAGGALTFFYQRHFAPDAMASGDAGAADEFWRALSPVSPRLLAGLALWLPAIVVPAFAAYHIDQRVTILGAALGAAGLGAIYWRYRQGLLALYALSSFSILFVFGLYIVQLFEAEDFQERFLFNSAWLWAAAFFGAVALQLWTARRASHAPPYRSGSVFVGGLTVGALVALAWMPIHLPGVYVPVAVLGYALALAGVLRWRLELSGRGVAAALSTLAFLIGPLYWTLLRASGQDVDGSGIDPADARRFFIVGGSPLLAAGVAFCAHPASRVRDYSALVALAFLFAAVHLLAPDVYRPSCYALITLANYYLLGRLRLSSASARGADEWANLFRMAPAAFVITMISFAALLLDFSGAIGVDGTGGSPPLALRAIMGVAPLVFLAFSLALHGTLFATEQLTPFQRTGYPALLLAFVLLTMSLIDVGWWSLAWAVLGVAAL
ncbi:MAG: DUF2339 domain-containing protein, partial [Leptospirales bacterium]